MLRHLGVTCLHYLSSFNVFTVVLIVINSLSLTFFLWGPLVTVKYDLRLAVADMARPYTASLIIFLIKQSVLLYTRFRIHCTRYCRYQTNRFLCSGAYSPLFCCNLVYYIRAWLPDGLTTALEETMDGKMRLLIHWQASLRI